MHGKPHLTLTAAAVGIALAACAFTVPALTAGDVMELQLTPAGEFRPSDGRELPVAAWRIDAAVAARVIERFKARKTPPVVDYEHQTLHKETNGQPAPAAAWMRELRWRDGMGLYATVELTERARELVQAGEYRYFSPVFSYDPRSGDVLEVLMGALTNSPAIDGMEPLALRAAATFGLTPHPEMPSMKTTLLAAACAALGLAATSTEEQAIAALSALSSHGDGLGDVRNALGLDEQADGAAVVAACTRLKTAEPDPAKYVPVAALTQVQQQLAALTAAQAARELDAVIERALSEGRLLAGEQETWARDLGKADLAKLNAYLKTAQPIVALARTQTGGRGPGDQGDDQAVASAAMKWQLEQAAAGVHVSTVQAVDHVLRQRKA